MWVDGLMMEACKKAYGLVRADKWAYGLAEAGTLALGYKEVCGSED